MRLINFLALISFLWLRVVLLPHTLFAQDLPPSPPRSPTDQGWQASYWPNATLTGTPTIQRTEPQLNFDWRFGSPDPMLNADNFSARWVRTIAATPGTYRFTATADDGIRLWVDNELLIDQWSDHSAQRFTAEKMLGPGQHVVQVDYYERTGTAIANVAWTLKSPPLVSVWQGEYFNNTLLRGAPVLVRADPEINFTWGNGGPGQQVGTDNFSARWTRVWDLPAGNYRFTLTVDDGARLFVNGQRLIDSWQPQGERSNQREIQLPGGAVTMQVEYYERTGPAVVQLRWQRLGAEPSPVAEQAPVAEQPPVNEQPPVAEQLPVAEQTPVNEQPLIDNATPALAQYRNMRYGVAFDYPVDWQPFQGNPTHYEGADGFFVIEAAGNVSLDQFVQNEVNHPLLPYGSNPQVENLLVANQDARLILPAPSQPGGMRNQAALVVIYPQSQTIGSYPYTLFVLYASAPHIRHLAETLIFE